MTNSYCGKNCEECTHRDLLECPGCKQGPGGTRPCQCELARCCRDKGLQHCRECTLYSACGKLPARNAIPVERLKAQEAEKEERAKLVQKSKILGPWLWALFLLVIPSVVASFLTNNTIVQWMPSLYVPGQVLNLLCAIVYSGILLRLSGFRNLPPDFSRCDGCAFTLAHRDRRKLGISPFAAGCCCGPGRGIL